MTTEAHPAAEIRSFQFRALEKGPETREEERALAVVHRCVFRVGRVSAEQLRAIARAAEDASPTYADIGATLTPSLPPGYRHDRYELSLPDRPDAFEIAAEGLRRWVAHTSAGLRVEPHGAPMEGATVAVAAPLGPMTAVAVCRVVAVVDESDRFGFAYGTLPGHPESGEETFLVERSDSGVTFTIVVFSRPAEVIARLGGPLTRAIQRSTSHRYLNGLASFVASKN